MICFNPEWEPMVGLGPPIGVGGGIRAFLGGRKIWSLRRRFAPALANAGASIGRVPIRAVEVINAIVFSLALAAFSLFAYAPSEIVLAYLVVKGFLIETPTGVTHSCGTMTQEACQAYFQGMKEILDYPRASAVGFFLGWWLTVTAAQILLGILIRGFTRLAASVGALGRLLATGARARL